MYKYMCGDSVHVLTIVLYLNICRSFIGLCNVALYVHGQLISKDQLLLQQDLVSKLHTMTEQLTPLLDPSATNAKVLIVCSLLCIF